MSHPNRHRQGHDSLQRAMQPARLTPEQRERHRRLIDDAFSRRPVEGGRARGKVEFAVVMTALIVIVVAVLTWGSLAEEEPDDADLEAVNATVAAQEQATVSALSTAVFAALLDYDPGTCEATPFATTLPEGVPQDDPAFDDWYGTPDGGLWAAPVNRGAFRQGPAAAGTHWFAGGTSYVTWYGTSRPLQIQGRQLDGNATFSAGLPTHTDELALTQWTAFQIPAPGCWSISAASADASLAIVISVAPVERRPDLVYLARVEAARPYNPPATCSISPVIGRDVTSDWYVAAHAYREGELLMSINQAWLAAGRAEPIHITGEGLAAGADIYARQVDTAVPFQVRHTTSQGRYGVVEFPRAGCWEVAVETPGQSTAFTVYVYPEECAPSEDDLSISMNCREPGR